MPLVRSRKVKQICGCCRKRMEQGGKWVSSKAARCVCNMVRRGGAQIVE